MSEIKHKTTDQPGGTEPESPSWFFRFLLVLLAGTLVVVGAVWFLTRNQLGPEPVSRSVTPQRTSNSNAPAKQQKPLLAQPAPTSQVIWNPVNPTMRELVKGLTDIKPGRGTLTPELAADWRKRLKSLIDQGAVGVSAIREFLTNNVDLDFNGSAQSAMGYKSVRTALFDALGQIGGAEAEAALCEVLQTTADPKEIATISKALTKMDAGAHDWQVLSAAKETLAMSADGKLQDRDVTPLFEVLQGLTAYGTVSDIAQSAQKWNVYAALSLAQLPKEAGVPALIELARGETGGGMAPQMSALQMLCQIATQESDARTALVELAQANRIPPATWNALVSYLAGDRMVFQNSTSGNDLASHPNDWRKVQIGDSNQSYLVAPLGALTTEQIAQQRAVIDQLLAVTTNPDGVQALQRARALLQQRATQVTNSQKPS